MATQIGILTAGGDTPGLNAATRGLGEAAIRTACADFIADGISSVVVAMRNNERAPVPLEQVAGQRKTVPGDHPRLPTARNLGVGIGDR